MRNPDQIVNVVGTASGAAIVLVRGPGPVVDVETGRAVWRLTQAFGPCELVSHREAT